VPDREDLGKRGAPSWALGLLLSLIWGVAFGGGIAGLDALAEGHIRHHLYRLALESAATTISTYLGVALAGGIAGTLLWSTRGYLARHLGGWAVELVGLASWLAASIPVFLWLRYRDRWLLPTDQTAWYAGHLLVGVCLVAIYFAAVRRPATSHAVARGGRLLAVVATISLVAAGGLVVGERLLHITPHGGEERPNVLLIVLDTVRADRLSSYGYRRRTTPELDSFAREAVRFTEFYSTSCWTIPSHASLFTGVFPVRHRATQETPRLDRRFSTLAELLRNAGYRTFGASGNPFVGHMTGLNQGFEDFIDTWRQQLEFPGAPGGEHPNNAAFEAFLDDAGRGRPFYAFLNYMDAHSPYTPPEPYRSRFLRSVRRRAASIDVMWRRWTRYYLGEPYSLQELGALSDLYDAEIAYLSRAIGELLEVLRKDGRFDDTVIVITSDHGEHFGENGLIEHMFGLYNTTVRVPLLIRLPGGRRGGEIDRRKAQHVDLFAAIARVASLDLSALDHHGIDLLNPEPDEHREALFSEYYYPRQVLSEFDREELANHQQRFSPYRRRLRAIQRDGRRLIWSSNGRHEFYDLTVDPGETRNLYGREGFTEEVERYLGLLERTVEGFGGEGFPGPSPAASEPSLGVGDPETREALRALGYVR